MDVFAPFSAVWRLLLIVLALVGSFVWFRNNPRQIHRGKVTSSTARPSGPRTVSPSHANRTAGPGRLINPSRLNHYAPYSTQRTDNHTQHVKQSTIYTDILTNRAHRSEELQYHLPTPNRSSAESSPFRSPYVPHAKPPIRHTQVHEPRSPVINNLRPLQAPQTSQAWLPVETTRTTLHPSDMGSFRPYVSGSIPSEGTGSEKTSKTDQLPPALKTRDSYRAPDQMTPIRIGEDLIDTFAVLSEDNTKLNIETVGILAGFFSDGEFVVSHLIIPEQHGTHDTCEVLNDEIMPGILADHELMQLGWIHVHPKYDAFLSSVDLHTHFSYQMMLPESIAIVWAPISNPNYGIFSLSRTGMKMIENCAERGFHTHPSDHLSFESASHVNIDPLLQSITVIDLRHS
jgi:STAM-binding protein